MEGERRSQTSNFSVFLQVFFKYSIICLSKCKIREIRGLVTGAASLVVIRPVVSLISLDLLQESNYKQPALSIMNWLKKKTYQENCLASWKTRFIDAEARMFIRQLFIFKHWRGPIWPTRHPLHLTDPTTICTNQRVSPHHPLASGELIRWFACTVGLAC